MPKPNEPSDAPELLAARAEIGGSDDEPAALRDLFRAIIEQSGEGIIVADAAQRIRVFNAEAERQHGVTHKQVTAPEWAETFGLLTLDEEPLPLRQTPLYRALHGERLEGAPWKVRRPDGTIRTLEGTATPLFDSEGGITGAVILTRDVTERMRAEKELQLLSDELRRREEHYRHTVELNPQVPWNATAGGAISGFSDRWLKLTGLSRESAMGEGWLQATHPDDLPAVTRAWMTAVQTGEPYDVEHRVRLADGSYRWMRSRAYPRRGAGGEVVSWYGATEDIHDKKQMESALHESERQWRELVENLPELAWSALPDGHIDFYNRRWFEYTGTTLSQMEGWGWKSVHSPALLPQVVERWQQSLRSGDPFEMEFPLRGADGLFRWFLTRVRPLRNAGGDIVRWFGTNTNIDEQRRQAAQLREALEARDTFLSIAGHELNTPLTSLTLKLQSLSTLLSRGPLQTVEQRLPDALESMRRQVSRLASLVTGLLDVSRIGSGLMKLEPEALDLSAVVAEVAGRFEAEAERSGSALDVLTSTPLQGSWDRLRLEQIVANLVSNAIKYGAGKPIHVRTSREGTQAVIEVRDEGVGIAAEALGRIFEKFERAVPPQHFGGLGLGLYVARQLVEAMGGTITVQSKAGEGALFTVRLPIRS